MLSFGSPGSPAGQTGPPCLRSIRGGSEAAQRKTETRSRLSLQELGVPLRKLPGRRASAETQPQVSLGPALFSREALLRCFPPFLCTRTSRQSSASASLIPFPWCRWREFPAPRSVRAINPPQSETSADSLSSLSGKRHGVLNAVPARTRTSHEMCRPSLPSRKQREPATACPAHLVRLRRCKRRAMGLAWARLGFVKFSLSWFPGCLPGFCF